MTTMLAPTVGQSFNLSSGRTYVADASGIITNVNAHDIGVLLDAGCTFSASASSSTSVTLVSASGASQAVAFAAHGDAVYDVTLSQACSFTITPPAGDGTLQRLVLIIRPAGFQASLPASTGSLTWSGGSAPVPGTSAMTRIAFEFDGTAPILGGV